MNENVLGIDLGTSSVKILQIDKEGSCKKYKAEYKEKNQDGWWKAILSLFEEIDIKETRAIGLTSQVGTYIVNERDIYSWSGKEGKAELEEILSEFKEEVFLKEISMVHPALHSYPLPRLLYFKRKYEKLESVCQPKDMICERLTGGKVTDPYSWRGLVNMENKEYSTYFLKKIGIEKYILPKVREVHDLIGYTKEIKCKKKSIPAGIPVFLGLNDFYASLIGMGVREEKTLFDITGTSEHLGRITEERQGKKGSITSPYLKKNVNYGVTSSSGAAIRTGLKLNPENSGFLEEELIVKSPICLPYLNGERAPIYHPDARGVFFGLREGVSEKDIFYSLMEGVVFSLYHIYESMGSPCTGTILVSGGAGSIELLNRLKAEIFEKRVEVLEETDTSAVGAAMIAAVGIKWYETLEEAQKKICQIQSVYVPSGRWGKIMQKRYQIYKKLYPSIKPLFDDFKELKI